MRAPVRKGCEELPVTITGRHCDLVGATGYWSGKEVHWNPTPDIVLLRPDLNVDDLRALARHAYLTNLRGCIEERLRRYRKESQLPLCEFMRTGPVFRNTFTPSRLIAFSEKQFFSPFNRKSWTPISKWIEEEFQTEAEREAHLVDAICESMMDGAGALLNVHRLNVSFLHLGMPLFVRFLDSFRSTNEAIYGLAMIRQFSWNYSKHDVQWAHENNSHCIRIYRDKGLPFAQMRSAQDAQWALGFSNAASLLLTCCVKEGYFLLPPHYTNLVSSCRLTVPDWDWDGMPPLTTQLLQSVVCSTTLKTIEDLPASPHDWLVGIKARSNMQRVFAGPIERQARLNPALAPWPLANLNRAKQSARVRLNHRVSDQVEEEFGPAWAEFARIYELASEVGPAERSKALRSLLPWAATRSFTSPDQISPRDLYDPFNPFWDGSFKYYLENNASKGFAGPARSLAPAWNAAARSYLLVRNYLKISPSAVLDIPSNPFEPHDVPFERGKLNKTVRKRLPTPIVEAMTEILMEPDEGGKPTYRWAMRVFPDCFEWFNPDSGKTERVLSPSRCSALALLLCLPFRGKQVQWLDRGLMDSMRWDSNLGGMAENVHLLAQFRYPDGESHESRYGRPSGVLQPMSDSLIGESHPVGIFVNTNKTAMWNPENRRGYEVPWPMIPRSTRSDLDPSSWVSRPYDIIQAQLSWIDTHLPAPVPVSFADSPTSRGRIHERYLDKMPSFCPIFADLSERCYKNDDAHTPIFLPVSKQKIAHMFSALCVETERRFAEEGRPISITRPDNSDLSYLGRGAAFDIHSLRVSGISRLIELGIPVSIVQEFIVGHATAVMTMYYDKVQSSTARQDIAAALCRSGQRNDWREYQDPISKRPGLWVANGRWAKYRDPGQMEEFVCWKAVPGGICPVGGVGCHEGGILDDEAAVGREVFIPVVGGCGNCRFFSTGPAFLVQQSQTLNEIMLELRLHGRNRTALIDKRSELAWMDTPELTQAAREVLEKQILDIQEAVSDVDVKIEPLVLEWINRLRMFEDSKAKLSSWNEFVAEHTDSSNDVALKGQVNRLPVEVDIRLEKAGEFSLVHSILQGAVVRGGLHHASALSKERCSAFMDRILRAAGSKRLLIDIADEKTRHEVAHKFAVTASALFGMRSVDDHFVTGEPLRGTVDEVNSFVEWAAGLLRTDGSRSSADQALISGDPSAAAF